MYTEKLPLFLVAAAPVHAGSGSDLGIVDLPIQRERHTAYPKIEASGLKGVLREIFDKEKKFDTDKTKNTEILNIVFGPATGDGHQAALGISDARILLFPVKSVKDVFAWITCPDVISKFSEAMRFSGQVIEDEDGEIEINTIPPLSVTDNKAIAITRNGQETVILEEYPISGVSQNPILNRFSAWLTQKALHGPLCAYQRDRLARKLLVVDDDTFRDFVVLSTEVIARTNIDSDTGTVRKGQLWYEEYLPIESILYTVLMTAKPFMHDPGPPSDLETAPQVMEKVIASEAWPNIIQLGGNATLGKGFVKLSLLIEEG